MTRQSQPNNKKLLNGGERSNYMSLSYDTAKKLKDAGFPQDTIFDGEDWYEDPEPRKPTLSELIAACGMYFNLIERITDNEWEASGFKHFDGDDAIKIRGKTPEEAVAALWLAVEGKE